MRNVAHFVGAIGFDFKRYKFGLPLLIQRNLQTWNIRMPKMQMNCMYPDCVRTVWAEYARGMLFHLVILIKVRRTAHTNQPHIEPHFEST